MKTKHEEYMEQLKKDCEKLQRRNSTPEAQEQHKTNSMRIYANMYRYYRERGCDRKLSRKYAIWNLENILGIKLE